MRWALSALTGETLTPGIYYLPCCCSSPRVRWILWSWIHTFSVTLLSVCKPWKQVCPWYCFHSFTIIKPTAHTSYFNQTHWLFPSIWWRSFQTYETCIYPIQAYNRIVTFFSQNFNQTWIKVHIEKLSMYITGRGILYTYPTADSECDVKAIICPPFTHSQWQTAVFLCPKGSGIHNPVKSKYQGKGTESHTFQITRNNNWSPQESCWPS